MKIKYVIVLLTILVLAIQPVSAGFFEDLFNKITGKVAENVIDEPEPDAPEPETIPEEEIPSPEIIEPETVIEEEIPSPDVIEPEIIPEEEIPSPDITEPEVVPEEECVRAGEETWAGDPNCCEGLKAVSDCLPNQPCPISQRYCVNCGNGKCESHENWYNCEEDCEKKEPPEKQCNDGEEKYYRCSDGTKVSECVCENEKWVCVISPKENCPDTGPGPETCAAKIKITFNKDVYKIGDSVKIMIEIFDSQGNHLPNYAFYGQMYDNMWHTPDLKETDNKGYYIHTGTAEKPAGGVTEVKFKVYTKETSSCGSVEDTAEVKFQPEECGIGECAPEPECKDKVRMCGGVCPPCPEDEDRDIFYPCSGCELENKCYPYGFRKAGNYCSDENDAFVGQLTDDEQCENNFECKTNLCINGNCVSSNLWNKFLEWFKKIVGGEDDKKPGDCSKLLIEKDIGDNEYEKSGYGEIEHTQAPVYSEDGENIGTTKCCMADYSTGATIVCPFDNKEDSKNSLKWILASGEVKSFSFEEYKGEKVIKGNDGMIIWTSEAYIVASGGKQGTEDKSFVEDIADAYLKKYKNDLVVVDVPYIPHIPDIEPKSFVFCTEEDKEAAKECRDRGGAGQSDPSTFDGTKESKERCIESKGYGEGCCEVYTGCIMPDEDCEEIKIVGKDECYWHVARLNDDASLCEKIIDGYYKDKCLRDLTATTQDSSECEKIEDSEYRDKCYVNVAEHTKNADICAKIDDESLQEKCYFWIAGQEGNVDDCSGIANSDLQAICYAEVAQETNDAGFCDKITDSHIGDKCYREVGIQTNNRELCEKIIEPQAKQKCLDNTS